MRRLLIPLATCFILISAFAQTAFRTFDQWANETLAKPEYAGYTREELREIWERHYGLAPSKPKTTNRASERTFRDPSDGVAFNYPAQWETKEQRTGQYRTIVGDRSAFGVWCMLSTKVIPALGKHSDLEAIRATTAKDIENGARNSGSPISIVTFEQTKIGNRPGIFYEANGLYQSLGFEASLKVTAGIVKVGAKLYELGCVAHPKVAEAERNTLISVVGSLTVR